MMFKAYDERQRKLLTPEELEERNLTLGSNGKIIGVDSDSFKADDDIRLWICDWIHPCFSLGKKDSQGNDIYQGDILKFTVDPVLADTITGGGTVEHFIVSNVDLKMDISNYNFTYDADILDSPAVLSVNVIGNLYTDQEIVFNTPELRQMIHEAHLEQIDDNKTTEEVTCDLCSHTWMATFDLDDDKIDCPNCGNHSHFEPVNAEDDE